MDKDRHKDKNGPKFDTSGTFYDKIFQYISKSSSKMHWDLIFKIHIFLPFWADRAQYGAIFPIRFQSDSILAPSCIHDVEHYFNLI